MVLWNVYGSFKSGECIQILLVYERVLDLINDSEIQCPVHGPKRIFFGGDGGGHWRRLT